jgi:phosphoribosylamine--glycine ligase
LRLLVIGSGGREHAICWRLAQSPDVKQIYCTPGNSGTSQCATNVSVPVNNLDKLADFARRERVDLTIVGPEVPLCNGIREHFEQEGLLLVGPSIRAAQLEGSKAFAKTFMSKHNIPTAPFGVFSTFSNAAEYIDKHRDALIVKADGLAAGKGAFVCSNSGEAKRIVKELLDGKLGNAGKMVVVESKLEGEEASFIVLTDGERICPFASSQDHQTIFDDDKGPNTGGMGAYSPAPILDEVIQKQVMEKIVEPMIYSMAEEGMPYQGVLYVGLMVSKGRASVLEFNCRFGDPEAQPLMMRLDDDLLSLFLGVAQGRLPKQSLNWSSKSALCVVMASNGYPGTYDKGFPIYGVEEADKLDDVVVFHAGTATWSDKLITSGGRVFGITGLGDTIEKAKDLAYKGVGCIQWKGAHYRKDIGARAIGRK